MMYNESTRKTIKQLIVAVLLDFVLLATLGMIPWGISLAATIIVNGFAFAMFFRWIPVYRKDRQEYREMLAESETAN
jgi:hypothetical protein